MRIHCIETRYENRVAYFKKKKKKRERSVERPVASLVTEAGPSQGLVKALISSSYISRTHEEGWWGEEKWMQVIPMVITLATT